MAWVPLAVQDDPLVRQPGSQPSDGVALQPVEQCVSGCHGGYDPAVEPARHWGGSMMAQAGRDPLFWAALTVAAQDSIWAIGRPNATDLCLRCHSPGGWLGGRSDPSNGSMLTGADFEGVTCDGCHRLIDPFFEETHAGARDGDDWSGYWDESGTSATPSQAAADLTLVADRAESSLLALFNGQPLYDGSFAPPVGWTEAASGQMFASTTVDRRGPFADPVALHPFLYSRFHKSRYFCGTCHDVSSSVLANLSFEGTAPGDGATVLPTEQQPAHGYGHIERTFSEFMSSAYAQGPGAEGLGPFAPDVFTTSRPGNLVASCQDCHLPDRSGRACEFDTSVDRPSSSAEHPKSGQPLHDLTGGNVWIPWILASSISGSDNYDATNAALLWQGPALLTMDLAAGVGMDAEQLLLGVERAMQNLRNAAAISDAAYDAGSGLLLFRIQNHTGHKLISGYPEGRRMFVNIRAFEAGEVVYEVNPYDEEAGTLRGLDQGASPPLQPHEVYVDELVYEVRSRSDLTGEAHTFHIALATERTKDNRIPPRGYRIDEAAERLSEPYWAGAPAPDYFSAAEYAGGYDDVELALPPGAAGVEITLYYQTTSREYVEFLRDEIEGTAATLTAPSPSGEAEAYVVQSDPFFTQLGAWGATIWQLWEHNRDVPGAAPVMMAQRSLSDGNVCTTGVDGEPCDDGYSCTGNDRCVAGVCVGVAIACEVTRECTLATCDELIGACVTHDLPNGTRCSHGVCTDGLCGDQPTGDEGGCSCRTAPGAPTPTWWTSALLLAGWRRRRRG